MNTHATHVRAHNHKLRIHTHSPRVNTRHLVPSVHAEHAHTAAPNDDILDVAIMFGRIKDNCSRSGGGLVPETVWRCLPKP